MKKQRYADTEDELEQLLLELETSRNTMEEATTRFNRASEHFEKLTTSLERKLEPLLNGSFVMVGEDGSVHAGAPMLAASGSVPPGGGAPGQATPALVAPAVISEAGMLSSRAPTPVSVPVVPMTAAESGGHTPSASRPPLFEEYDYLRLIGHDLKEPLRGILWFAQNLMEEQAGSLGSESRESLEYIHSAARRAQRLLDDVLALAQLRQRSLVLQENALQLLLDAAQARVKSVPGGEGLHLEQPGLLPKWVCDRELLEECFYHVLRNAVQYSVPPAHVTVEWSRTADSLELRFRDRGIGIPSAYVESIFGLFQRLHSWEAHEGTGAGLTLVRLMMKLQGGTIHALSSPGRGATFVLRLPSRPAPREQEPSS
ncbi:MAG: sensor histidine kinase [Myxococcota bacterium]